MEEFWLTRLVFQRALALIYVVAFLGAINQFCPLLGERGLLPAPAFIRDIPFRFTPSLFYLFPRNTAFIAAAWVGLFLSGLALTGISERFGLAFSITIWSLMWGLYLSFVNVGQTFYGFGWESILLEAGFYAIFLGSRDVPPPKVTIWMLRWLLFRVMFGAGLIKLRGDSCWRDLSCLNYHYETQPMPNPLSWYLHWMPGWTHRAGVMVNHIAELIVPWGYFFTGGIAALAGLLTILFQSLIMASGNLSWLNALTIVLAIPAFNDRWLSALLNIPVPALTASPPFQIAAALLGAVVAALSINPIRNMISPRQVMNTSYNPLHLVGTYGAFGGITRTRYEIIIEGTADARITQETVWREYEFKGKPGHPARRPPQIAPYHLRLDWLMWFAAMSSYREHPWFVGLIAKLLQGDKAVTGLLRENPFAAAPPRHVRALIYEYHFTTPQERRATGHWWTRKLAGSYFPPVSLDMPEFRHALQQEGWL